MQTLVARGSQPFWGLSGKNKSPVALVWGSRHQGRWVFVEGEIPAASFPFQLRSHRRPQRKASQSQDDGREDCFRYTCGGRHLRPVPSLLLLVQHLWPGSFASLPSLHAHAGQQGEPCSKSHNYSLLELFSSDVLY